MRINTDKLKGKVIVHCDTKEKARVLIDTLGLKRILVERWDDYKDKTCYWMDSEQYVDLEYYNNNKLRFASYTFIEFDKLILPERSKLAEILGVEDEEEFEFEGRVYGIINGGLGLKETARGGLGNPVLMTWWKSSTNLADIINNMDKIVRLPKPPKYSAETIKKAKAAIELYREDWWVARDGDTANDDIFLYSAKPIRNPMSFRCFIVSNSNNEVFQIRSSSFPEITFENSPIQLKDIVNSGNESND